MFFEMRRSAEARFGGEIVEDDRTGRVQHVAGQ